MEFIFSSFVFRMEEQKKNTEYKNEEKSERLWISDCKVEWPFNLSEVSLGPDQSRTKQVDCFIAKSLAHGLGLNSHHGSKAFK